MKNETVKSLLMAQPDRDLKIAAIRGGMDIFSRLASLGIFPGMPLQVLQKSRRGQLMVLAKGSRIAIGKSLGDMIMVEEK